ncbi:MAG: Hsp20/alpha crystallin family protein [Solobacterium sp.]|jgi:HSP20 family molecular chaperone IbpA|nr:Hsp20/alpha crystallin family protein [Erysipelotrichaceae bacterium]MBQ1324422.1 Hsp20/alpha crystallin family protein [Solobacterium sp.]MBQ1383659.1 Hsp20/alpha crystallin family protein [Solobacterium sp.]MBQ1446301.1 Hsp20/alpha crystallin family protein [Solobacterium sp.]MBQ2689776.1 Hsp20/alpha crystallin family protein [Solobacterium sp.]
MRYIPARKAFEDMIDDWFPAASNEASTMKTDVHRRDGKYIIDVDVPGYAKEDIRIALYRGNLTITAEHNETKEEKDEKGTVIRKERWSGTSSRTFYVGEHVTEKDVHAKLADGILTLEIPTEETKKEEEKKYIDIF